MRLPLATLGSIACCGLTALVAQDDPLFRTLHTELFQVGTVMAQGDLDEDGRPDIAALVTGKVRLAFGRGDGSFETEPPVELSGVGTNNMTIADVDEDGHLDLLTTGGFDHTVYVSKGNGDGSFQTAQTWLVDNRPRQVIAAHLNGDAHLDLAVSNDVGIRFHVLLADGSGSFLPPVAYGPTGTQPRTIAAIDLDGDQDRDLVLGNFQDSFLSVFVNDGQGAFSPDGVLLTLPNPRGMAVDDLDDDGHDDLLVNAGGTVQVFLGTGAGGLAPPLDHPVGFLNERLLLVDVDEDGLTDVAVCSSVPSVWVLRGLGDGSFDPPRPTGAGGATADIAAADWNGDGELDFATIDFAFDGLTVVLGRGDFVFGPHLTTGGGPRDVLAADFDSDGVVDLVVANETTDDVSVFRGLGDAWFEPEATLAVADQPVALAAVDATDDGLLDLVVVHQGFAGDKLSILPGDGALGFGPAITLAAGNDLRDLAVGDLDGNGKDDFATVSNGGNALAIVFADRQGGYLPPVIVPIWLAPESVLLADVDDDQDLDVVTGHNVSINSVQVHLNDGQGNLAPALPVDTVEIDRGLSAADFDGDGHLDLVGVRFWGAFLVVLPGHGDGTFGPQVLYPIAENNPADTALADVDNDGVLDVVVAHEIQFFDGGAVGVFPGNGDGSFQPEVRFFLMGDVSAVATADLDGDGVADVAATSQTSRTLSVLASRRGPWDDLGQPLAGTNGLPHQTGEGSLESLAPLQFTLSDALPLGGAFHVVGFTDISVPFKGGVMVPSLEVINGPLPIDGDGRLLLAGPWVAGLPSGLRLYFQFWFADAGGPVGFAASNALRATMP